MRKIIFFFLIATFFFHKNANTSNYANTTFKLFKVGAPGKQESDYDAQIKKLREILPPTGEGGPVYLEFSNGKHILVDRVLGSGSVSLILSTENNQAIRIPKKKSKEAQKQIDDYYEGWKILSTGKYKDQFLFDVHDHLPGEFLIVDQLDVIMDYEQFQKKYKTCYIDDEDFELEEYDEVDLDKECNYCDIEKANNELLELALFTSEFSGIQDINERNVVYVRNKDGSFRWVILDFALPISKYKPGDEKRLGKFARQGALTPLHVPKTGTFGMAGVVSDVIARERGDQPCNDVQSGINFESKIRTYIRLLCEKWKKVNKVDP